MPYKNPEDKRKYQQKYFREYYANPARKAQVKKNVRNRKRSLREWYLDLKRESSCIVCGMSGEHNPWAMEFHHRDPEDKTDLVSALVSSGYSKKRIQQEIEKCDVVCANCHRAKHYHDMILSGESIFEEMAHRQHQKSKSRPGKVARRSRRRERKKKREQRLRDNDEKASEPDDSQ